ncbi:hypothetical protein QSJ18_19580 [Gordonia sp. ABSL1-1]|uniref:hypothetical protein n=1 Tax=Gordonia sp. ABSL1-1 TaxID=3053923 RepID=UPI002574537F|nr:hypothetical protein [Gordonia sp. ABSL1-1]MDL9938952.1 hypothetical protein [Gordonia sp. ABSL1-1]
MTTIRMMAAALAVGATATLGVVGATPDADAAPAPSAKVCVSLENGQPYRGPISLLHREWWEFSGRSGYPAANGCITFHRIIKGKIYRAVVDHDLRACNSGRDSEGNTYKYGRRDYLSAVSREKRAPRTGQIDFGRIVAHRKSVSC